jgi:hypothetical protein
LQKSRLFIARITKLELPFQHTAPPRPGFQNSVLTVLQSVIAWLE